MPEPKSVTVDLSTPESAILSLEDAYRAKDLEAALKCKDFNAEARLMFEKLNFSDEMKYDPEILQKTAETLELGFRAEINKNGFPDFKGATSTFSNKTPYQGNQDVVQISETVQFPRGKKVVNKVFAAKGEDGWKFVLIPEGK